MGDKNQLEYIKRSVPAVDGTSDVSPTASVETVVQITVVSASDAGGATRAGPAQPVRARHAANAACNPAQRTRAADRMLTPVR